MYLPSLPLFSAITTWLTPFWLVSAGALVAMVVLGLAYGVIALVSKRLALWITSSLREGFLLPVLALGAILSVFAIAVSFAVPFEPLMRSLTRLAAAKEFTQTRDIPADAKNLEIDLEVVPAEVSFLRLTAEENMYFTVELPTGAETFQDARLELLADEPFEWSKARDQKYLLYGDTSRIFVTNNSAIRAPLKIEVATQAEHPEVRAIPLTAAWSIGLVVGFLLLRALMPRVMAVATTTAKEALAQPLFQIVLVIGITFLTITVFIPYNTFGEDVKMLKNSNLEFIMILSILVAVWTASVGISEEIEGRTALTVLSKPIGRPQFLLGKFLGVLLPVLLLFLFLGTLFLLTVSFKVVYDARESAQQEPIWQNCFAEMIGTVPGLALAFMETIVMAAISVAIATRLPMLANLSISFTIYLVGHLLPLLVISKKVSDPYGIIQFMGQFFAIVLPVLEHFNIYAAIAGGATVEGIYLAWALAYCALYSCIAMLFALLLFEERDLA
jgi:ABC-type transport system involved in multi-copper enzyme maturation permease subunit